MVVVVTTVRWTASKPMERLKLGVMAISVLNITSLSHAKLLSAGLLKHLLCDGECGMVSESRK